MEGHEFDSLNKDDLAFSVFVELVENYHSTYIFNIKDAHLEETRKAALKALIEASETVPEKEKMNERKFKKMKDDLKSNSDKFGSDIQVIETK